MMQAQLPEGLRALMQASQILQQESSPVVQTPVGPKPTVAGQVAQGLEQAAQTIGMQGIGQQVGLGAQIQAQEMARQQQMAQNPEAIAQLAANLMAQRQQPAESGIANIPVNMQFKQGGIVGYGGEEESYVRSQKIPDRERVLLDSEIDAETEAMLEQQRAINQARIDASRGAIGRAISNFLQRRAVSNVLQNSQAEVQDVGGPSLPSIGRSAARAAEASRQRQGERLQASRLQQPEAVLGLGAIPTAPEVMPEKELFTSPETAFVKQVSTPSRERPTDRVDQGRQTTTPAPQDTPQPSAAPVREVGIAQAIQPPTAPTIRGIAAEAQAAIPDIYKDVREQREKTAAEREKYLKGLPSIEIQGIAAIEQARRERQEALAASREDDNMRRFLAAMRSIGQRTGDYENTLDRIAQREELHRKANLSETEAILKLREAEHQRGLGQFDRADALTKAAMEDIKNLQAARGQAMQSASTLAGNVFQGQSTFAAAQLREQGEERRKAEEIKMRKQELETTRQGTALVAAQGRVDSAQKIYNDAFKEFGFIANMKDADLKNDVMKNQRDEARKILNSIQNEQLNPAIQYRDSLYAKVLGVSPSQSRKPSTEGWGELRVN